MCRKKVSICDTALQSQLMVSLRDTTIYVDSNTIRTCHLVRTVEILDIRDYILLGDHRSILSYRDISRFENGVYILENTFPSARTETLTTLFS